MVKLTTKILSGEEHAGNDRAQMKTAINSLITHANQGDSADGLENWSPDELGIALSGNQEFIGTDLSEKGRKNIIEALKRKGRK